MLQVSLLRVRPPLVSGRSLSADSSAKKPLLARLFGRRKSQEQQEKESELQAEAERVQQLHEELEQELQSSQLQLKRNKSRLSHSDRQILHDKAPLLGLRLEYKDEHRSQNFKQAMFGKYGAKSTGLSPNVCWPTVKEIREQIEYEETLYDGLTLREMMRLEQDKHEQRIQQETKREALIESRLAEQLAEARRMQERAAARDRAEQREREKREAIIKEMRDEYGYEVDLSKPEFALKYEEKLKQHAKRAKDEKKRMRKEAKAENEEAAGNKEEKEEAAGNKGEEEAENEEDNPDEETKVENSEKKE